MSSARPLPRALPFALVALCALAGCGGSGGGGDPPVTPLRPSRTFVHVATADTLSGAFTFFSHPLTDGDPDAPLLVTPVSNPDGRHETTDNPHPIGVAYNAIDGLWAVFNQDYADMTEGAAFFVHVAYGDIASFDHTVTTLNRSGNSTRIEHPGLDGEPDAGVFVTQVANAGPDRAFVTNAAHVGVWYGSGHWRIFNEDLSSLPIGADFAIVRPEVNWTVHTTTVENSLFGWDTHLDLPGANGNPDAHIQVTPRWEGDSAVYDDDPIALWYDALEGRWAIIHSNDQPIPLGALFNVWVVR